MERSKDRDSRNLNISIGLEEKNGGKNCELTVASFCLSWTSSADVPLRVSQAGSGT